MESLAIESLIDRYTDNLMRAAFSMGFPSGSERSFFRELLFQLFFEV